MDGFHLARASRQGWEGGASIYQAIRAGEKEERGRLLRETPHKEGERAKKARQYVERNIDKAIDWRIRSGLEGRSLGTMEANGDKLEDRGSTADE